MDSWLSALGSSDMGGPNAHRLDRGGNRQLNAALDRIAITQARYHESARAYLERKKAEGEEPSREAIRCLKRLLVRVVFNTLKASPAFDIGATVSVWGPVWGCCQGGAVLSVCDSIPE